MGVVWKCLARHEVRDCVQVEYFDDVNDALDFCNTFKEFKMYKLEVENEQEFVKSDLQERWGSLWTILLHKNYKVKLVSVPGAGVPVGWLVRALYRDEAVAKARKLMAANERRKKAEKLRRENVDVNAEGFGLELGVIPVEARV